METNETIRLLLSGMIAELDEKDGIKVKECISKIMLLIDEYGDHGILAISYVAALKSMEL